MLIRQLRRDPGAAQWGAIGRAQRASSAGRARGAPALTGGLCLESEHGNAVYRACEHGILTAREAAPDLSRMTPDREVAKAGEESRR